MLNTIIAKELKRIFSDKRMIFSVFLLPALSIYLMYTLMGTLATSRMKEIEVHQSIVKVVNAPESFKDFYNQYEGKGEFELSFEKEISDEMKEQMKAGEIDAFLEFPTNFAESVAEYEKSESPDIFIYFNPTEDYSRAAGRNLEESLLKEYKNSLLSERFGDMKKTIVFTINETKEAHELEIKNEKKSSGFGAAQLLPMLLSIMLFASAMGIGMETIAGEKERGTMGALLLTPVSRNTIALGKMISLGILAIISTLISVIAVIASLPKLMSITGDQVAAQLMYGPKEYLQIAVILILEVGIFVGIICLISVMARTVKEAGTYITPAYMVVMLGAFGVMFSFGKSADYMYAIPLFGNILALKSALTFELTMLQFLLTCGVSLILIAGLTLSTAKAFKSEKIMFNA